MPSSHLILCHPLLLLPPIPPSIRVFSNESTLLMRWSKYWSFSFSIIPSKEIPGLISFKMVGFPCSPRDSRESSPTPQFKSVNSSALSLLHRAFDCVVHNKLWKILKEMGIPDHLICLLRNLYAGLLLLLLSRFSRVRLCVTP